MQILENQRLMQRAMRGLEASNQVMNRRQQRMEYKMNQFYARSGLSIDSPSPSPQAD